MPIVCSYCPDKCSFEVGNREKRWVPNLYAWGMVQHFLSELPSLLGPAWSGTIVEENHSVTKKTRTIFLAACCKISSVAQYLVVVTAPMFQEVHQ
jgi:hypothetical protein